MKYYRTKKDYLPRCAHNRRVWHNLKRLLPAEREVLSSFLTESCDKEDCGMLEYLVKRGVLTTDPPSH